MSEGKVVTGAELFTIVPSRTALLVVDMQEGFVAHGSLWGNGRVRAIVPTVDRLVEFARAKSMPIVWTQSDHSAPASGVLLRKIPVYQDGRMWPDDPEFAIYRGMTQPRPNEHRVVKHKYDPFLGTDLDAILRNCHVETVLIAGTMTDVCCEAAARSAFERDYEVAFVADATATSSDAAQSGTLERMDLYFGRVVTAAEALQEMDEALGRGHDRRYETTSTTGE